jgi:hypothetical protein
MIGSLPLTPASTAELGTSGFDLLESSQLSTSSLRSTISFSFLISAIIGGRLSWVHFAPSFHPRNNICFMLLMVLCFVFAKFVVVQQYIVLLVTHRVTVAFPALRHYFLLTK